MPDFDLQSLLIAPDRGMADQFLATVSTVRAFQIIADLKQYPPQQAMEMRLRQLEPDVVLLDVATDPVRAGELIDLIHGARPGTAIVALDRRLDSQGLVSLLRRGVSEFLAAPFEAAQQQEALARIRKVRVVAPEPETASGYLAFFSSVKPGSGASTLTLEIAKSLARKQAGRVLVIDGDLGAGGLRFGMPLTGQEPSLVSGLASAGSPNWFRGACAVDGVDLVPAPPSPHLEELDWAGFAEVFEPARRRYDFVLVDLPVAFEKISLVSISSADLLYLVTTADLASLHLARRAVALIQALGFGKERARVIVNRVSKREVLVPAELDKLFSGRLESLLPAETPGEDSRIDLGKAVEPLTAKLMRRKREKDEAKSRTAA